MTLKVTDVEEQMETGLGFSDAEYDAISTTSAWTDNTCNSCGTNCCSTFNCQATLDNSCPTRSSTCVGDSC